MVGLFAFVASAAPDALQPACDIPTAPLSSAPGTTAADCAVRCADTAGCGAFVFISGWNRCVLHPPASRRVTVRMVAATVETTPEGARAVTPPRVDHDHGGRDLEAAPRDLPSAEACGEACVGTAACTGYVYVEGYRACWLKQTPGALTPKTFTCGAPGS
jgi:hypothetical protein